MSRAPRWLQDCVDRDFARGAGVSLLEYRRIIRSIPRACVSCGMSIYFPRRRYCSAECRRTVQAQMKRVGLL